MVSGLQVFFCKRNAIRGILTLFVVCVCLAGASLEAKKKRKKKRRQAKARTEQVETKARTKSEKARAEADMGKESTGKQSGATSAAFKKSYDEHEIDEAARWDTPHCRKWYHIFNRAPEECVADITTDRPHLADATYTIEGGHYQLETEVASPEFNGEGHMDNVLFFAPVLRMGLLTGLEYDIGYESLNYARNSEDKLVSEGGDQIWNRMKINLYGGNHGPFTVTVAPVYWAPLKAERKPEYGGVLFMTFQLPLGVELETNSAFYRLQNGDGYDSNIVFVTNFEKELSPSWEIYQEFFHEYLTDQGIYSLTIASGVQYKPTNRMQIDLGFRHGVRSHQTPLNIFLGFSYKI